MPTDKTLFLAKVNRAHAARIKAEEFVAAGGDLQSSEAEPIGREMLAAWDDLTSEFGNPILRDIKKW
jgi:hypothetical protein